MSGSSGMSGTGEAPYSLLAPDGSLRPEGEGVLSDDQLLEAFRIMHLSRAIDDLAVSLQRQGRVAIHAPARGQEAASVGSALALDPARDWIAPQYRELPAYLHHGLPLRAFWMARLGVGPMGTVPDDLRMLPVSISIAAQIPQAVGLAWGLQLRGSDGVVIAYFGDGGASEGDFHEGANLAGVVGAPVILFCQNNGWAITTPRSTQTGGATIAARAAGYGMPGVVVDGNDVVAVHQVTRDAVDRARQGGGPTLIEAVTYRLGMHNTSDDPTRYMDPDELAAWSPRDPLLRLRLLLEGRGLVDDASVTAMLAGQRADLEQALQEAEAVAAAVDPVGVMFDNVFEHPPARQQRQRAEAEGWAPRA
jgi:pyruvate dehydrogenase E1 component alpha subunit